MKKFVAGGMARLRNGVARITGRPTQQSYIALVVRIGSLDRTMRVLGAKSVVTVIAETRTRIESQLAAGQVFSASQEPDNIRLLLIDTSAEQAADLTRRLELSCRRLLVANGIGVHPEIDIAWYPAVGDAVEAAFEAASNALPRRSAPAPQGAPVQTRPIDPIRFAPQCSSDTGRVTGFRALDIRANALRDKGEISCDEAVQQVLRVMRRGLGALTAWDRAGWDVARIVIDLPLSVFADPQFADFVGWELDRCNIAPQRLCLSLTEDISLSLLCVEAASGLTRLAAMGCSFDVTMANAGHWAGIMPRARGRSRLSIERGITRDCDGVPAQQTMLLSVVSLAEHYGWEIIASGAERSGEHFFLSQMGCHTIEGRAIAAAMALDETHGFLMERAALETELPRLAASA